MILVPRQAFDQKPRLRSCLCLSLQNSCVDILMSDWSSRLRRGSTNNDRSNQAENQKPKSGAGLWSSGCALPMQLLGSHNLRRQESGISPSIHSHTPDLSAASSIVSGTGYTGIFLSRFGERRICPKTRINAYERSIVCDADAICTAKMKSCQLIGHGSTGEAYEKNPNYYYICAWRSNVVGTPL